MALGNVIGKKAKTGRQSLPRQVGCCNSAAVALLLGGYAQV